jgi:hypothetical protein
MIMTDSASKITKQRNPKFQEATDTFATSGLAGAIRRAHTPSNEENPR